MSTHRILSRGVATLLAIAPFTLHAATQTITAFGDPQDGTQGTNPSWGIPANWTGPNGAVLPGVNDVAQIQNDQFSLSGLDIRGSDFAGGITEVQGLTFTGSGFPELYLENNSTDTDMILALNGGGGTVPLIQQTTDYTVRILGVGAGVFTPTTRTLTLQLRGSGAIEVGNGGLDLQTTITQSGGTFGFNKTGAGIMALSGTANNTYTGTTTISAGTIIANKPTGINAISGNLVINAGGKFMYRDNNVGNQIANGATITLNGGDFGDIIQGTPTNPGAAEQVTSVIVNSGYFSTGRAAFIATGLFSAAGGTTLVHRGGTLSVGSLSISNGGVVDIDGGSTGVDGRITVGAGGMNLSGGTFNFNAGISGLATNSFGSVLTLNGNVTAPTGTTNFIRANPGIAGPKANVELGAAVRTFNVSGTLNFGTPGVTGGQVNFSGGSPAAGSITKTGTGTLNLTGTSAALTGAVAINAGTLALNGSFGTNSAVTVASGAKFIGVGAVSSPVTINNGGTIQAGDASGVGTLTVTQLKLGNVAGDTETINLSSTSTIIVTQANTLVINGGANTVTVNITGAPPAIGVYPLIDYPIGSTFGTFGGLKLGSLPSPRLTANLVNNTTGTVVNLNVTALDFPIWKGALSSEWSTVTLAAPKNWVLNSNNATTTDFLNNDFVSFTDLATNTTVDVSVVDVTPSSMTFSNVTKDYTLTGSKSIASGNLTKSGAGKLTINSTNSFTGSVSINGGTISVATLGDVGVNSPLGAGPSFTFNNGGTLEYTGGSTSTNRAIALNGIGKIISNVPLTLGGNITGAGTLTKQGTGSLVLTGTNTYGATVLSGGTLQVGDGGSTGSLGTGAVTNDTAIIFNRSDTALTVPGAISGAGTVTQIGFGSTTLTGTTANTYAGLTKVSEGALIAGKTPGINAIPGDLLIEGTASFIYMGNNVSNQIADSATITLNGGNFGDPVAANPTNPGATDTVANVNVFGGQFNSGRNDTIAPFTISGLLDVNGGSVLAQRGGSIAAGQVHVSNGFVGLDGGSATAGQESKLIVGGGGLTLTNNSIYLNAGPSPLAAGSVGSIVTLNGNLTSTGTSGLSRLDGGVANGKLDLGGGVRDFNVTGTLEIGAQGLSITVLNGGINKTGAGALTIHGAMTLSALTIGGTGIVKLDEHAGGPAGITPIDTGALTFIGNTRLDLTNNAMVVRNGNYAALKAKTISGFNGGLWDGPGIDSSTAQNDPTLLTAIGIVNNADAGFTDFAGLTGLGVNDVVFKYTYVGDNDLNGIVNLDDFGLFQDGRSGALAPDWLSGDYDYNGVVNLDDFGLFQDGRNFHGPQLRDDNQEAQDAQDAPVAAIAQQLDGMGGDDSSLANPGGDLGAPAAAGAAVVPEPGSVGLLAIGALGLLSRRRRR